MSLKDMIQRPLSSTKLPAISAIPAIPSTPQAKEIAGIAGIASSKPPYLDNSATKESPPPEIVGLKMIAGTLVGRHRLSEADKAEVIAWLVKINETNPAEIARVMRECSTDPELLKSYLTIARGAIYNEIH